MHPTTGAKFRITRTRNFLGPGCPSMTKVGAYACLFLYHPSEKMFMPYALHAEMNQWSMTARIRAHMSCADARANAPRQKCFAVSVDWASECGFDCYNG